jgi:hypothetical protein
VADALLRLDGSRLPEVLAGEALRAQAEGIDRLRENGIVYRTAREGGIVDHMQSEDATRLFVDEVFLDASYWLDQRTGRPLGRLDPPTYRRRILSFEEVDGAWKCVWATYLVLGPALS